MATLPRPYSRAPPFWNPGEYNPNVAGAPPTKGTMRAKTEKLLLHLRDHDLREHALLELSMSRERIQDLAPMLWHSFGTICVLIQEIISINHPLSATNLTSAQSDRLCNVFKLLQVVAAYSETRILFLKANIPFYLYAFLDTSMPVEKLRLTSLGVFVSLVMESDTQVISFLTSAEFVPLSLRAMEMATFILEKILAHNVGLDYVCDRAELCFAIIQVLWNTVAALAERPSPQLLGLTIGCYFRLSCNPRASNALRICLPPMLTDGTFSSCPLEEKPRIWLQRLLHNVGVNWVPL